MDNTIDIYLDNYNKKNIDSTFFNKWVEFGFDSKEIFKLHVLFYIKNFTNITYTKLEKCRDEQKVFSKKIFKLYDNKCVVSGVECIAELEAAHIRECKYSGSFSESNGILLTSNLHKTFDDNMWTINPNTFKIEVNKKHKNGSINKYNGQKLNLIKTSELINNLQFRYDLFIKNDN